GFTLLPVLGRAEDKYHPWGDGITEPPVAWWQGSTRPSSEVMGSNPTGGGSTMFYFISLHFALGWTRHRARAGVAPRASCALGARRLGKSPIGSQLKPRTHARGAPRAPARSGRLGALGERLEGALGALGEHLGEHLGARARGRGPQPARAPAGLRAPAGAARRACVPARAGGRCPAGLRAPASCELGARRLGKSPIGSQLKPRTHARGAPRAPARSGRLAGALGALGEHLGEHLGARARGRGCPPAF